VPDGFDPELTFGGFLVIGGGPDGFLASTPSNTLGRIALNPVEPSVNYFTLDGITFVFPFPIKCFGIDISTGAPKSGTFTATTDLGDVVLSYYNPFPDFTTGQFVGFTSTEGFSSVTIAYNRAIFGEDGYVYGWTLDTMRYPIPSTLLLLGSGLAGLGLWRGRKLFKKA